MIYLILALSSMYVIPTLSSIHDKVSQNQIDIKNTNSILRDNTLLTERIEAEQKARTENVYAVPYLKNKIQTNPINSKTGILKVDNKGNILEASAGMYTILKLEKDDLKKQSLLGKSIAMMMSKDSWEKHQMILAQGDFPEEILMNRVVSIREKRVKVYAKYLKTERVFIINMEEI